MNISYGFCFKCGHLLQPIFYEEVEYIKKSMIPTGRTKMAVSYLFCENCGNKELVDDTFDENWHY